MKKGYRWEKWTPYGTEVCYTLYYKGESGREKKCGEVWSYDPYTRGYRAVLSNRTDKIFHSTNEAKRWVENESGATEYAPYIYDNYRDSKKHR